MKKIKMAGALLAAILSMSTAALYGADMTSVKPNGCKGPVLCSSFPIYGKCNDCCDYRWHIDIGLLYEQPWISNMTAGMQMIGQGFVQTRDSTQPWETVTAENMEQCFNYSPGVIASLGHLLNHDEWFIGVNFMWLSSSTGERKFDLNNATYLVSINNQELWDLKKLVAGKVDGTNTAPGEYLELIFDADISIYQLDFILSRGSYHSRCFSYEPFAAVKALWYSGKYKTKAYNWHTLTLGGFEDVSDYLLTGFNMSAWGIGPEFGFNGEYHITEGLSIFSDSNIAILYGQMRSLYTYQFYFSNIDTDKQGGAYFRDNSNQQYFIPLRSTLGIKLAQYCMEDKHYVAVKIGYDINYVFARFATAGNGDIAASGLYVNFIWDY